MYWEIEVKERMSGDTMLKKLFTGKVNPDLDSWYQVDFHLEAFPLIIICPSTCFETQEEKITDVKSEKDGVNIPLMYFWGLFPQFNQIWLSFSAGVNAF